ncbi:protein amalgam-like [Gigantopelta aegis]|uniref:protein amalgam-like n=1 Tax=Gigantopelta aegis TaxID=1735272 RepID=UPI001B88D6AB|nr:protein amalgam-like [Gigantopelta aegis]
MTTFRELRLSLCIFLFLACTVLCDDPIVQIMSTSPLRDPLDDIMKSQKDRDSFMTCSVTNLPKDSEVKWMAQVGDSDGNKYLVPISSDLSSEDPYKYSLEKPSPTAWRLKIQNVQVSDEGTYICRVQTGPQNYVTDTVQMRIIESPQIADLQTSSDTTVKEGDHISLSCNASGRPFPLVWWSRMAGELLPTGGQELQEYILDILSVRPQHSGIYKCSAKNLAGYDSRNIHLKVKFAPRVTKQSPQVSQAIGYYKDLICYVSAFPVPSIDQVTWVHETTPVYEGSRFSIRNIPGAWNRIMSILTIRGVQESDYGTYTCSAANQQGDGKTSINLMRSDIPTTDRTGQIRSGSSVVLMSVTTVVMILTTCLLHSLT